MRKQLCVFAAILAGALCVFAVPMASASSATTTAVHCERGASLQAAIDSASPGRTLWVTGTCDGNFVIDKNLRLTANNAFGAVTLDGNHAGTVVMVSSGAVVTITGFRITNGLGDYVAAADIFTAGGVTNLGMLTLNRVAVTGNTATPNNGHGGISSWFPGVLTVNYSTITGNTSFMVSGVGGILIAARTPQSAIPGPVTLNNTTVSENTGSTGGIQVSVPLTLSNSKVIGNTSTEISGTGGIQLGGGDLAFTNSTVRGNTPCNFPC